MGLLKGNCLKCNKFRNLRHIDHICAECSRSIGICVKCNREKIIFSKKKSLCKYCSEYKYSYKTIDKLKNNFNPKTEYNKYLFELYITYIKRYCNRSHIFKQLKNFKSILETTEITPFKTWVDIFKESIKYKETYGKPLNSGCPFKKTGLMLEELGVLNYKAEDVDIYLYRNLNLIPVSLQPIVSKYVEYLLQSNRSKNTIIIHLAIFRFFNEWMIQNYDCDILIATNEFINKYLDELICKSSSNYHLRQINTALNRFYKWCLINKYIISNPCNNIKINRKAFKIIICSEEDVNKIYKYIKSNSSDPERAMMLVLVLFYGFNNDDLRLAKLNLTTDNIFNIIMYRKPLTCGYKYYNRNQTLRLPNNPEWFYNLQIRYYKIWLNKYDQTKKTFPDQFLFLGNDKRRLKPLNKTTIIRKFYETTILITGKKIPVRVIHQTCGHIYSITNDASILSKLGWSLAFSFDYTWMPKEIYVPKIKS